MKFILATILVAGSFIAFAESQMAKSQCRMVEGGWQRCSKSSGKCFGAVFKFQNQCEDALNNKDD